MNPVLSPEYAALDIPQVLNVLFHPRPELNSQPVSPPSCDLMIPVAADVAIGARFHLNQPGGANILFFHGNGEIVADYDDLGPIYNRMDINFLAVDYRGYGRSGGTPTVSAMIEDCGIIFKFVHKWLNKNSYNGPFIVMGRSLGSASAIELAHRHKDEIDALIVESGFAQAGPLLRLLGVDPQAIGFNEEAGFQNIEKIKSFNKPTLIIHAEYDHIIPYSDGESLFKACTSEDKTLLKIPDANHNDIFMRGLKEYLAAVKALVSKAGV
jgi:pimeloyl-ACP methyl ester carboxylesterase